MTRKIVAGGLAAFMVSVVAFTAVAESNTARGADDGTRVELQFEASGKILVRGAKVTGISGSTIQASTAYGALTVNWNVETDGLTEIVRRTGGISSVSEISVGDYISFRGVLSSTATKPTVKAAQVKDWSIQKRRATFLGTVTSVMASSTSFMLNTREQGDIKIETNSGTEFKKEKNGGSFADIAVGAKVQASGIWNNLQNVLLQADRVKIYQSSVLKEGTSQGILKAVSATSTPTTLTVTIGGADYAVNVVSDTSILNAAWGRASLSQLRVGDKIRVYGVMSGAAIDASVVRDISI